MLNGVAATTNRMPLAHASPVSSTGFGRIDADQGCQILVDWYKKNHKFILEKPGDPSRKDAIASELLSAFPDIVQPGYLQRFFIEQQRACSGDPKRLRGLGFIQRLCEAAGLLSVPTAPPAPVSGFGASGAGPWPQAQPASRLAQPSAAVSAPATQPTAPPISKDQVVDDFRYLRERFFQGDDSRAAGAEALRELLRSGRSICIASTPGSEDECHDLLLMLLYMLLKDDRRVEPIAFSHFQIFDPEGRPFWSLEERPDIVRSPLVFHPRTHQEWIPWIDMLWEAYSTVRERRACRQRLSASDRRFPPAFDTSLFVFPDWSHWATQWSLRADIRKKAVKAWMEWRRASDPCFETHLSEFAAPYLLGEILKYGPRHNVRLMLTANNQEFTDRTGLTSTNLPYFGAIAIGQYINGSPRFAACERILASMEDSERKPLEIAYNESRRMSKESGLPVLLIRSSGNAAEIYGAPETNWVSDASPMAVRRVAAQIPVSNRLVMEPESSPVSAPSFSPKSSLGV
jgi:hypothetical protein